MLGRIRGISSFTSCDLDFSWDFECACFGCASKNPLFKGFKGTEGFIAGDLFVDGLEVINIGSTGSSVTSDVLSSVRLNSFFGIPELSTVSWMGSSCNAEEHDTVYTNNWTPMSESNRTHRELEQTRDPQRPKKLPNFVIHPHGAHKVVFGSQNHLPAANHLNMLIMSLQNLHIKYLASYVLQLH